MTTPFAAREFEEFAESVGSVTRAGRLLGFGWGASPLVQARPRVGPTLPEPVEAAIVYASLQQPTAGSVRLVNVLARRGLRLTTQDVLGVWQRHDLDSAAKRDRASRRSQAAWPAVAGARAAPRAVGRWRLRRAAAAVAASAGNAAAAVPGLPAPVASTPSALWAWAAALSTAFLLGLAGLHALI